MRTTKWTPTQQDAIRQLQEAGRIQNERPCGCFDVFIEQVDATFSRVQVVLCDTCRSGLAEWRPAVFGAAKTGL